MKGKALAWTLAALLLACSPSWAGEGDSGSGNSPKKAKQSGTRTAEATDQAAEAGTTNLTQSLQGEGGVTIQTMCTNCNSADLSVGGMTGENIEMTCDGLIVPPGLARVYLLSVLPPTVIENIEVDKGAGSAQSDGGAVGGTIDLTRHQPRSPFEANLAAESGQDGWRGFRMHLGLDRTWFQGSLIGTYGRSDLVDGNQDGNPDMPRFNRRTIEGRARMKLANRHLLSLGASYYEESQADGPAAYDFFNSTPDKVIYNLEDVAFNRKQFDLLYEAGFRDGSRLRSGGLYANRYSDISETLFGPSTPKITTYLIDEDFSNAEVSWTKPLGNRMMLRLGVEGTERRFGIVDVRYNITQGVPFADAFDVWQREKINEDGIWAETTIDLGRRVDLNLGARYVDYSYEDEEVRKQWLGFDLPEGDKMLPRVALTWKPSDATTLRFSAGAGYRQPPPSYEEVCCGRRYRGNRGIKMEESTSVGAEFTYQPGSDLRLNAAAFITDFDNQVVNMAVLVYQFQTTYQHVNVPKSRTSSLTLDARYSPARWVTLEGSVSWQDHENRSADDALPALLDFFNTPREFVFHTKDVPYLPDSTASLGVDISFGGGYAASLSANYTGSMPIQRFDAGFSGVAGSQLDPAFFETEDFWIVNLYVSQKLRKGFEIFLGADNIGDYVQPDLGDPLTDYNWGPLRGSYVYGGVTYGFGSR